MKKPFAPEVTTTRVRTLMMYEVDCRQWKVEMRALGYPLRRRFATKEQARSWRDLLVVESTTGRPVDVGPQAIGDLSALYLQSIEATVDSKPTIYNYRSLQKKFLAFCDRNEITDARHVSTAVVELYRVELHTAGLSAYGVRAALQSVRGLFSWAARMGYGDGNPASGIAFPKPRSKRRAFTADERTRLLDGSTPELAPLWRLLFLTGLRRIEIVRLQLEDAVIDSPAPFIRVHGKGDKYRTVPLTPAAIAAVRYFAGIDKPVHRTGYLLPWEYNRIWELWAAERKRLGLAEDLHLHSFRHTFISWLANRTGTPLTEVQRVAGHSSVTQTVQYVHPDETMLRAGMARLEDDLVPSRYPEDIEAESS